VSRWAKKVAGVLDTIIFDKMGLRIGDGQIAVAGQTRVIGDIEGFYFQKTGDFREPGLLVASTVFALLAILFLVPVIEDLVRPKFILAVAVCVFLAAFTMQDFLTIRNRGETNLMLITAAGDYSAIETTSIDILNEAAAALLALGIPQKASPGIKPLSSPACA